jgi:ssDNA-binding Zn-finger/Zn-ribbon topoisomerase 1
VNKEVRAHVEAARVGPYAPFVERILTEGLRLGKRHVDDKKVTDHHAVIPTKQRINAQGLSPDEKRIYDLIARRFLAAFFPDAEIERTSVTTLVEGEKFQTKGSVVLVAGWREVDPPGREKRAAARGEAAAAPADAAAAPADEEGEEAELPPLEQGQSVTTLTAEAVAKQTKAPPRYSESSLLGAMETAGKKIEDEELRLAMRESGLGTPATRAAIIETLLKREYVAREKKSIIATPKGVSLIRMLPAPLLKSAELTGMWERKLALMARGAYERESFMAEVREMVGELVKQIAAADFERGQAAPRPVREIERPDGALDCPRCKQEERAGFLVERAGQNGKFVTCSTGRDVCGYISDAPRNAKQRKALLTTRCHVCGAAMRLRLPKEKGRRGSLACTRYPDCQAIRWFDTEGALEAPAPAPETGPPCPRCQTPMLKRGPASSGNYFWSCPRWRGDGSGCDAKPIWINSR